MRRNILHEARTAFVAFDDRLDAWAERHWAVLRIAGYTSGFALLFAGVALHAYESGVGRAAGMQCGPVCRSVPGFEYVVAVACGAAAILFVGLYAGMAGAVQRGVIDPWKYVRPEPAPARPPRWARVVHVLVGFALFLAIAWFGKQLNTGHLYVSLESLPPGGFHVGLGQRAMLELILGWWVGGGAVLRFFWPAPAIPGGVKPGTRAGRSKRP